MKSKSRRLGGCVPKAVTSHSHPQRLKAKAGLRGMGSQQGELGGQKGWVGE